MTEITQEGWKNKALSMLLAQLTSYVLFIAATVIPSPGTVPIIPLIIAALTLAAFVVFWPFRGSILDRIVTLVFGAISLIFVIVPFPTSEVPPDQTAADGSVLPWYSWALAMGLLLLVLVVFSFGRQMAREKREHLIRALSHAVTSGVAALAVAGWCFLPDLGAMLAKGTVAGTVALIILIVLGLALAVASTLWVRDADPDPDIRYPWIGTGLMPVMLMGVTIAAKITNSLRFDDNRNLVEEHRKISRCNKRAEGLEKILYKCPRCGAEFKNVTKGNVMKCEQCGNTVEYGRDGILHAIKGKTFDYISDWYDFERQDLKEQVTDENFRLEGKVALYVNNEKLNKFVKDGEGTLSVSKDGIKYVGKTGENKSLEFKIENRGTIAFKMGENLEVSEDGNIYRFAFTEGLFSTKFVLAIEELHKRYFD